MRTLVSSAGETDLKSIRRKNKRTALLQFSGFVCAASNKAPLTKVQSEGIQDRRLILIPFTKRVHPLQIKSFEKMFSRNGKILFHLRYNKINRIFILFSCTTTPGTPTIDIIETGESNVIERFLQKSIAYAPDEWVMVIVTPFQARY